MNSINGIGSLGNLCNVSGCNNFTQLRPQAESTVPEQRDMVSLGQETPEQETSFPSMVGVGVSSEKVADYGTVTTSEKAPVAVTSNSVDAGNGLRATMSDLGVLTLLDDPAIESLDQCGGISDTVAVSQQNTLAMINLNSMDSILSNGLIPM